DAAEEKPRKRFAGDAFSKRPRPEREHDERDEHAREVRGRPAEQPHRARGENHREREADRREERREHAVCFTGANGGRGGVWICRSPVSKRVTFRGSEYAGWDLSW